MTLPDSKAVTAKTSVTAYVTTAKTYQKLNASNGQAQYLDMSVSDYNVPTTLTLLNKGSKGGPRQKSLLAILKGTQVSTFTASGGGSFEKHYPWTVKLSLDAALPGDLTQIQSTAGIFTPAFAANCVSSLIQFLYLEDAAIANSVLDRWMRNEI